MVAGPPLKSGGGFGSPGMDGPYALPVLSGQGRKDLKHIND
jgi:hypothetical protein